MQTVFTGMISPGFQFASGDAVGREKNPSPFSAGTLALQRPHFKQAGLDLEALIPGLHWATINLELDRKLLLVRGDFPPVSIDWAGNEAEKVGPETFSFVHCCFVYPDAGNPAASAYHPGLIYYPHPETKPGTNRHNYGVLEVLTRWIGNLRYGTPAGIICRADAFRTI